MNFLRAARVGDYFRWDSIPHPEAAGKICRITELDGLDVHFVWITGDLAGKPGYTTLPQAVTLIHPLEALALELE